MMKTSRQQTAEIEARLRAVESWRNSQEEELAAALAADAAHRAAIDAPYHAERAARTAESHQADAEFLAWRRQQGV